MATKVTEKQRNAYIGQIIKLGFHAWHHEGETDVVTVSAEHGDGAAHYYGSEHAPYPWISPKLEQWAGDRDLFWEWNNPGSISAYFA